MHDVNFQQIPLDSETVPLARPDSRIIQLCWNMCQCLITQQFLEIESQLKILSESDWLERVESLLGYLTMSWDGLLVVTGDVNIDMRKPSDNLTRKYQTLLEAFSLKQIVTKPTRVTGTSKTHILVNFPQNVTYTDVIPYSMVGDHDAPFVCINVRIPRFQPRFKFLRNEKELDKNAFKENFSLLPLDVVYGLESPDDMVDALNSLIKDCLDRHAPLRRVKVARPPANGS